MERRTGVLILDGNSGSYAEQRKIKYLLAVEIFRNSLKIVVKGFSEIDNKFYEIIIFLLPNRDIMFKVNYDYFNQRKNIGLYHMNTIDLLVASVILYMKKINLSENNFRKSTGPYRF